MAKTKHTKPSKTSAKKKAVKKAVKKPVNKPTNKGLSTKDLPESVKWLLGFLNIKNIAGEYNPRKLIFARKPNRTPTIPPKNIDPEDRYFIDYKGYVYVPGDNNKPLCIGKENPFPTPSDFRKYFETRKISNATIVKNKEMFRKISGLWDDLSMAFARVVTANQLIDTERLLSKGVFIDVEEQQKIGQSIISSHCRRYLDNYDLEAQLRISRGDWLPDIKLIPDVIYIGILTWLNCKELRTLLRQCRCCGTFWFEQKQKGRPRVYCSDECGDVFSPDSREKEIETKKRNRETKRRNAKPKIIKHIMKNGFEQVYVDDKYVYRSISKERAKEIYDEASPNNTSSLIEFIRTTGKIWPEIEK